MAKQFTSREGLTFEIMPDSDRITVKVTKGDLTEYITITPSTNATRIYHTSHGDVEHYEEEHAEQEEAWQAHVSDFGIPVASITHFTDTVKD